MAKFLYHFCAKVEITNKSRGVVDSATLDGITSYDFLIKPESYQKYKSLICPKIDGIREDSFIITSLTFLGQE